MKRRNCSLLNCIAEIRSGRTAFRLDSPAAAEISLNHGMPANAPAGIYQVRPPKLRLPSDVSSPNPKIPEPIKALAGCCFHRIFTADVFNKVARLETKW